MEARQLAAMALSKLEYTPNPKQREVLFELSEFVLNHRERDAFVINGYAGTGKTSLIGALIGAMAACKMKTTILAPTGRAAKVASAFAGKSASTIHRNIYRLDLSDGFPKYHLGHNNSRDVIYIVDEASMITDEGRRPLLTHLIKYIYQGYNCAMIMIGDCAQLPPVGLEQSIAMRREVLTSKGLHPIMRTLDEVARQSKESGILHNATLVRRMISDPTAAMPALLARGFADVEVVSSREMSDYLASSWSSVGQDQTLIITRSNKRANLINQGVRRQVMFAEQPIERGERLVVSKNNYFWAKGVEGIGFIANGETITVTWTGRMEKHYGRVFCDIEFQIAGSETILGGKLMLRSLMSEGPSIGAEEQKRFYDRVMASKEGELSERIAAAENDEYYNALQAKYAYCVTCHKAQGGQWRHVYIDLSGLQTDGVGEDYYRWLYTAITRATEKVYLVNPSVPVIS